MDGNGLQGLGNISLSGDSSALATPGIITNKTDGDSRKLATDGSKFADTASFASYLQDWLQSTGIVTLFPAEEDVKRQVNFNDVFCTRFNVNGGDASYQNSFCIFAALSLVNVQNILQLLLTSTVANNSSVRVVFGYCNFDKETKELAKRVGAELVGFDEIYEINKAIDDGFNHVPYMSLSGASFHGLLAKELNGIYNRDSSGNFFSQSSANIKNTASNIGNDMASSFQDGFGQLKNSVLGAVGMFKQQLGGQQGGYFGQQAPLEQQGFGQQGGYVGQQNQGFEQQNQFNGQQSGYVGQQNNFNEQQAPLVQQDNLYSQNGEDIQQDNLYKQ